MIFLFAFHLILRIVLITQSHHTFYSDDAIYVSLARLFVEGDLMRAIHPTWPPLYPFFGALLKTLLPSISWENTMRLVSALVGSLTVYPLTSLFGNFTKRFYAKLLAFFVLMTQPFLLYSILPYSDALATFLALVAVSQALAALRGNKKAFVASGIATGAMYLTRSEGTLFFGVILSTYCFYALTRIRSFKLFSRTLGNIAFYCVSFIIVASPYIVITAKQFGRVTLSPKFSAQIKQGHSFELKDGTTWSQEAVSIKEPNYDSSYFSGGVKHIIRYNDWYWFWFTQKATSWFRYVTTHFPPLVIVSVAAGIILLLKKKSRGRGVFLLYLTVVGVTMTIFATPLTDIRYLMWVFPLIILALAATTVAVFRSSVLSIFIIFGLMYYSGFVSLSFLNTSSYAANYDRTYYIPEFHEASDWIVSQGKTNPRVMMRHEGIEFYTNGETIYMPQTDIPTLIDYAREKKVDYIVAWDNELIGDGSLKGLVQDAQIIGLTKLVQIPQTEPKITIYTISVSQKKR